MVDTTPRTWVSGEVVTAAELNTEVRDFATALQASWTTYTPSWTGATTNPVIGNGTLTGSYRQVGNTVDYKIKIVWGSSTTGGTGNYFFSLPVPAADSITGMPMGNGTCADVSGPTYYQRQAIWRTGQTVSLHDPSGVPTSNVVPFTTALGDEIFITGRYEAA